MSTSVVLSVENRMENLSGIATQAETFLESQDCDAKMVFAVQVALEELFTNIVRHAYGDPGTTHLIDIRLESEAGLLTLEMEDDGLPFDPLSAPAPDISLPVGQRPVGGLGLFITRRLASNMSYQRIGGKNRITLRFNRAARAP